jgi:hypothetical protein
MTMFSTINLVILLGVIGMMFAQIRSLIRKRTDELEKIEEEYQEKLTQI